jgi:ubiquitin C-terminal hydrolase
MNDGRKGQATVTPTTASNSKTDYHTYIRTLPENHRTFTMAQTGNAAMRPAAPPADQSRGSKAGARSQASPTEQQAAGERRHFPAKEDSKITDQTTKPGNGRSSKPKDVENAHTDSRPKEPLGTSTSSVKREPPHATPDLSSEAKATGTTSLNRDSSGRSGANLPTRESSTRQPDKPTLVTAGSSSLTSTTQTPSLPYRTRERVGLRNLGNTCFMNSILQCVAHTPGFIDSLLEAIRTNINRNSKLRGQLAEKFGELMEKMRSSRGSVSPDEVKHMVGRFAPQFSGYMQQDAHEFLRFLLDGLHEDLNRVQNKQPYRELEGGGSDYSRVASEWFQYHKKRDDSVVTDYFRGQLLTIITCSQCNTKSIACDTFLDLSVPVPRTSSVQLHSCFNEFIAETLVDEYKCEKCRKIVPSRMEMTIWKFPPILVIHLKRFSNNSWRRSKIDTDVVFPAKGFSLSNYSPHSNDASTRNAVYRLFGVSHHMGDLGFGHYVA